MSRSPPKIQRSPLHTVIPKLTKDELGKLDYYPGQFEGARDVDSPVSPVHSPTPPHPPLYLS